MHSFYQFIFGWQCFADEENNFVGNTKTKQENRSKSENSCVFLVLLYNVVTLSTTMMAADAKTTLYDGIQMHTYLLTYAVVALQQQLHIHDGWFLSVHDNA